MDDKRRAELIARRAAMNVARVERAWRQLFEPALSAIEAADIPHRTLRWDQEPGWQPSWSPAGYSYMPWDQLPLTIEAHFAERTPAYAAAQARAAIAERAAADTELRIMHGNWSRVLRRDDLFVYLEAILQDSWDVWIVQPGCDWMIEVDPRHLYLCERGFADAPVRPTSRA